jgi:hypothetical protein
VGGQTWPVGRCSPNGSDEGGQHLRLDVGGTVQTGVGERPGRSAEAGEEDAGETHHPTPVALGSLNELAEDGIPEGIGGRRMEEQRLELVKRDQAVGQVVVVAPIQGKRRRPPTKSQERALEGVEG